MTSLFRLGTAAALNPTVTHHIRVVCVPHSETHAAAPQG